MNAQKSWKSAYRRMQNGQTLFERSNAFGAMQRLRREAALERKIEAQQREVKNASDVIEWAYIALGDGDFKNGVTDPTGTIDEGEIHAGKCFEIMRQWLLHHETTQNYVKA